MKDSGDIENVQGIGTRDASPNTCCPTSPISCSVHMEPKFTFSEDSRTPTREYFIPNPHGQTFLSTEDNEQVGHPNPFQEGCPRTQEMALENC